jgi:hypothetical protein
MAILRQDKLGGIQHTSEGPSRKYKSKMDVFLNWMGHIRNTMISCPIRQHQNRFISLPYTHPLEPKKLDDLLLLHKCDV